MFMYNINLKKLRNLRRHIKKNIFFSAYYKIVTQKIQSIVFVYNNCSVYVYFSKITIYI